LRHSANAKCATFFTKEDDGLAQDWGTHRVFVNPPFGRKIGAWVQKCWEASQAGALVVLLAACRTDTAWWHDWVQGKADVEFVRGRLRFGGATENAPFPVATITYWPEREDGLLRVRFHPPALWHEGKNVMSDEIRALYQREQRSNEHIQ
jgi:hypothetical protein